MVLMNPNQNGLIYPSQSGPSNEEPPVGQSRPVPEDVYPYPARAVSPGTTIYATPGISDGPSKYSRRGEGWRSVASTLLLLLIAPLIALAIAAFVIQSYQVDGESMETTLQNHDRLIVDKVPRTIARLTHHNYIPHRGDIIIFNQAGLIGGDNTGQKQLIKRVIGLPGDRVQIKGGKIAIYNDQYPGGFNPDLATGYHITAKQTSGDVDFRLQANQIFVCGDNRPNSEDSRFFGPINANNIVGKLVLRLVPVDKLKRF
jgi:signal peptidase I